MRRKALETYIQTISQMPPIARSPTFIQFFNNAQKEVQVWCEEVQVDVYLCNGRKLQIECLTTDQTNDILEAALKKIGLTEDLTYYFALFLVQENGKDGRVIRRLQDFESPYISLERVDKTTHKLMIRRAYWNPAGDKDLLKDDMAVNMLYVQATADLKHGRIVADADTTAKLAALKEKGSKVEYLQLMRKVKNYGHEFIEDCVCDYPQPGTFGMVSIGCGELRFHDTSRRRQYTFFLNRMRCWKIAGSLTGTIEFSFEYLRTQTELGWTIIKSSNAIYISMTLQAMVDEMMRIKQARMILRPQDRVRAPKPVPRPRPSDLVVTPAMPLDPKEFLSDDEDPSLRRSSSAPAAAAAAASTSTTSAASVSSSSSSYSGLAAAGKRDSVASNGAPAAAAAAAPSSGGGSAARTPVTSAPSTPPPTAESSGSFSKMFARSNSRASDAGSSPKKADSGWKWGSSSKSKGSGMLGSVNPAFGGEGEDESNATFNLGIGDEEL